MGNKCCGSSEAVITDGGDLKKISVSMLKDPVQKFEYKYPFHRMDVEKMFKRIHDLGKDMMSIEDLRTMLKG